MKYPIVSTWSSETFPTEKRRPEAALRLTVVRRVHQIHGVAAREADQGPEAHGFGHFPDPKMQEIGPILYICIYYMYIYL